MDDAIKRCLTHDYRSRCIYMITLKKEQGVEPFGEVIGDAAYKPGDSRSPFLSPNHIGSLIIKEVHSLEEYELAIKVLQYALMPDHLHILIFVKERTKEHLGKLLIKFKRRVYLEYIKDKTASSAKERVFQPGYNDRILFPYRSLKIYINYLRENAYRYQCIRQYHGVFVRMNRKMIAGEMCKIYGNPLLLDSPFIDEVIVHRRDDETERKRKFYRWRRAICNRDILISAFIAPDEKVIFNEAVENNGRVIYIQPYEMGEKFKPSGKLFEACKKGNLLMIFPDKAIEINKQSGNKISREVCLYMNKFAEKLSQSSQFQ